MTKESLRVPFAAMAVVAAASAWGCGSSHPSVGTGTDDVGEGPDASMSFGNSGGPSSSGSSGTQLWFRLHVRILEQRKRKRRCRRRRRRARHLRSDVHRGRRHVQRHLVQHRGEPGLGDRRQPDGAAGRRDRGLDLRLAVPLRQDGIPARPRVTDAAVRRRRFRRRVRSHHGNGPRLQGLHQRRRGGRSPGSPLAEGVGCRDPRRRGARA